VGVPPPVAGRGSGPLSAADWGQPRSNTEVLAHGVGEVLPDVFKPCGRAPGQSVRPGSFQTYQRPITVWQLRGRGECARAHVEAVFGDVSEVRSLDEDPQRKKFCKRLEKAVELVALEISAHLLDQLGGAMQHPAIERASFGHRTAEPPSLCGLGSKSCRLPSR